MGIAAIPPTRVGMAVGARLVQLGENEIAYGMQRRYLRQIAEHGIARRDFSALPAWSASARYARRRA